MRRNRFEWLALVLVAAGCATTETKKEETQPATEAAPAAPDAGPATTTTAPPSDGRCTADIGCNEKQLCIRGRCTDISMGLSECRFPRIHFDFDSYELKPADRQGLERVARCLRADQYVHITIEGASDERGTEDYNLRLGDKRATEVQKYLIALGVSSAQMKTVSYGKDAPLCSSHNEDCWSKNRRASIKSKEQK